jgi:hypothetical protein
MAKDYFEFLYFLPSGMARAKTGYDPEIVALGITMRDTAFTEEGARIPGTPLTVRVEALPQGAKIEFDYEGKLAYQNFCCFEKSSLEEMYTWVYFYYRRYNLGTPDMPWMARWMHLVPVAGPMPEEKYSLLSQQWAFSYFCTLYARQLADAGRLP